MQTVPTTGSSPRRPRRLAAIGTLLPVLALAPFSAPRQPAPASLPGSHDITITAKEYGFLAPDTVLAGLTHIRLLNRGTELHHVQLIRLDAGKTMKDFFAAFQAGGPPPAWAHMAGGPNTPVPGGESRATLELPAGRYAIICFIPAADGKPHVMKGMAKELIVVAPKGVPVAQAGTARPTATLTLTDYHFTLSSPLKAGANLVHVQNGAKQGHEVLFVKLAPGKTVADMEAWVDKQQGPPPGAPVGGTTGLDAGGWNDIPLTLEKGDYGLLCFWPDAKDGKPHIAHGMATQFTIR